MCSERANDFLIHFLCQTRAVQMLRACSRETGKDRAGWAVKVSPEAWKHLPGPGLNLLIHFPGLLHCVPCKVDVPVEQVEETEGQREQDTGVLVNGTGACQLWDLWKS